MSTIKKRNWAFILYPDSAPSDWRDKIKLYGVPCAVSPLHDSDLTDDGTSTKKPHYHIILAYKHPTTFNNVCNFVSDGLNQNKKVIPIQDLLAYYRYLAHLDNPEKSQYSVDDIVTYCGFKTPREKMDTDECVVGLFDFIRDNQITDYAYLIDVLSQGGEIDLLQYAVCHAYAVISYLRSAVPN